MSTILWVRGEGIFADSKHINWINNRPIVTYLSKIHIAKDKSFAYTYTGELSITDKDDIDKLLKEWIEENKNYIKLTKDRVPKNDITNIFGDYGLILLPNGNAWLISKIGGILLSNQLNYFSCGTGSPFVNSYMELTGDPVLSMELTRTKDNFTDGDINQFLLEDFKK